MTDKISESSYAKKLSQRGGRDYSSLGNDKTIRLPVPKPFLFSYMRKDGAKLNNNEWKWNQPFKHENLAMLRRIQDKGYRYPKPKIRIKKDPTIKYDHVGMNYYVCP